MAQLNNKTTNDDISTFTAIIAFLLVWTANCRCTEYRNVCRQCNNNDKCAVQLFIIYVMSQQPHGQLHRQHRDMRKIQKYKQQKKSHMKEAIKITPQNNGINSIIPVKEKFVKL